MVTLLMPQGTILPKGREITANIKREPVHGDPMPHAHADRRDFAASPDYFGVLDPNPGKALAPRGRKSVLGEKIDEHLLEPAQIAMQILSAPAKIDNRITHQLSRSVIGRLAAAIDRKKRIGKMRCAQQTRSIGGAPDRVNRLVLEQKQFVR